MAGFLFNFSAYTSLEDSATQGTYGTIFKSDPNGFWSTAHEAVFGDYCLMRPGDDVFFFSDRRLYGVGRLIPVGSSCSYQNFPTSTSTPHAIGDEELADMCLLEDGEPLARQRWVCFFEPSPHFFMTGVDMDDALTYRPESFRVLRAMYQRSFIRLDDEESQALRDVILRANRDALKRPIPGKSVFPDSHVAVHNRIGSSITPQHELEAADIVSLCANNSGSVNHEMAIEAGLVYQLVRGYPSTEAVFGQWDYVSHQVTGSPPKPPMYIDHMDVFGMTYLQGRTASHYSVVELKKGSARAQDVEQLMKYVDWIKDEYCYGDYGMVKAFLVAQSFDVSGTELRQVAERRYTIGRRPARTETWLDAHLATYAWNPESRQLDFLSVMNAAS